MSDRPRRKRKQNNTTVASNVHYVGYVEDEESVEAIMKKFEELDRIQREFSSMAVANPGTPEPTGTHVDTPNTPQDHEKQQGDDTTESANKDDDVVGLDSTLKESQPLTEEQLQEVFKRTSAFTVKSAMMDTTVVDDMDAMELWQVDFTDGNTDEVFEEDDYIHVDDDFWDMEFGESPRKRGKRSVGQERRSRTGQRRMGGSGVDREKILARYKVMQVQVQDRDGRFFMIKKRVSAIDPSLPTYVRIPGTPIPRSWAHTIMQMEPLVHKNPPIGSRALQVRDILSTDLTTFGNDFTAVYMDPPLLLPDEEPTPGKIHIDDLAKLNVHQVVKAGFLFIWIEKEWIRELVRITKDWGFKYVENFCWIKKNVNNQIARQPFRYFNKSKLSLLIFRKDGDTELRHQRNPDCVFDFIKPRLPNEISESKPSFVYQIIETLLPTAVYHPESNPNGDRLLELWAKRDQQRTGWTTIVENHTST
ncbi:uncharacterized protein BX664DRAFT_335884 [Halteromyces radiatus]|uniref:uncharacterized protein n=1 Tax=Halteromyces radiatus TaxID=101107 RepID=UPI00221F5B23|nr:uncharacterized protein BX664DRAFT_335884 [Halteromyces radiatus]KAI8086472.1 hypothetical protein BX664DRAFT_335884 [Halteromyces radiatus]